MLKDSVILGLFVIFQFHSVFGLDATSKMFLAFKDLNDNNNNTVKEKNANVDKIDLLENSIKGIEFESSSNYDRMNKRVNSLQKEIDLVLDKLTKLEAKVPEEKQNIVLAANEAKQVKPQELIMKSPSQLSQEIQIAPQNLPSYNQPNLRQFQKIDGKMTPSFEPQSSLAFNQINEKQLQTGSPFSNQFLQNSIQPNNNFQQLNSQQPNFNFNSQMLQDPYSNQFPMANSIIGNQEMSQTMNQQPLNNQGFGLSDMNQFTQPIGQKLGFNANNQQMFSQPQENFNPKNFQNNLMQGYQQPPIFNKQEFKTFGTDRHDAKPVQYYSPSSTTIGNRKPRHFFVDDDKQVITRAD